MVLQSKTEIYIGGTKIKSFKRFVLNQDINAHHFLKLECRTDVLESLDGEISNSTKNYLGETLQLEVTTLSDYEGYKELLFKGVVTAITSKKGQNNNHIVSITAQSPTVLSDDGSNYNSYIDKTLSDVLDSAFEDYDTSKLKTQITPANDISLHYCVQHKESSWHFASRLAMQYGEWFFYDGEKLIFGKPEDEETILLTYGHDLQEFSLELIPLPNNFNFFTNDYLTDENHEKKTTDITTSTNGHSYFVKNKSQSLYPKETNVWVNGFNDSTLQQRTETNVTQQKKAVETQQIRLKGSSDNPGVGIGKIIDIKNDTTSHGLYRVINVRHINNENVQYHNVFEAISTDIDVFPDTDINAFPKSETQTAIVTDNADPEGLARIKVQFPWQQLTGETTPWIRVATPHGGSEKGFHFIPEKQEEVLIAFEGANAERPYMMGSLYNGSKKPESWKTSNNNIKAIKTRSGHLLKFTEDESIILTDKSGNEIHLDTTGGNINITAPETMTFNCKNMVVNVSENMTTSVGMNKSDTIRMNSNESTGMMKSTTVGMNANMMVMGNLMEFIQGNLTSEVLKEREETASEIKIKSNQGNITKNAKGQIQNNSGEKGNNF